MIAEPTEQLASNEKRVGVVQEIAREAFSSLGC